MCVYQSLCRRKFFRLTAAFTATGIVGGSVAIARKSENRHYKRIDWNYYTLDKDFRTGKKYGSELTFSEKDRGFVQAAMNIVASRFHRPDILQTTFDKYKNWYLEKIKTKNVTKWKHDEFRKFVEFQFSCLWETGFPKVKLYPWEPTQKSDEGFAGWGTTEELVQTSETAPKDGFSLVPFKKVEGEFILWLSLPKLRALSADDMAGTIAHEMLHNMGHAHNAGYKDNNFITVFGDTLGLDGKYADRSKDGYGLQGVKELPMPG